MEQSNNSVVRDSSIHTAAAPRGLGGSSSSRNQNNSSSSVVVPTATGSGTNPHGVGQSPISIVTPNSQLSRTTRAEVARGGSGTDAAIIGDSNTNRDLAAEGNGIYKSKKEAAAADDYIAALENIHKTYLLGIEGVPALRGVNVEIRRGEFLVIFGTSGGGKSTLLNILGTIDVPTKGNLMLHNSRITDRTPDADLARIRCRHIGFVFQSFNLLSTMTAEENVSLPMIIAGDLTRAQIKERSRELLMMVGLGHRMDHYPSMLSGGEQQRVTIARSLANEPDMLLMDEPTGDLDTKNTHLILNLLLDLNRTKNLTMVMVTHDVYMKPYADRILYLRDGRVANIEDVPENIKEQAYEHLLQKVEKDKQQVGEHVNQVDEEGKVAKTVVRTRNDYDTRDALRNVDASADADMRAAVELLFGPRSIGGGSRGKRAARDGNAA